MTMSPERAASVERILSAHPDSVLAKEWEQYRADKAAGIIRCVDCKKEIAGGESVTEINPEGGYDRPLVVCCDSCMNSGRWSDWIADHWPNWPNKRSDKA